MCELCESNEMIDDGRKIIKNKNNKYILEFWECQSNEIDDTYSLFGTIEITQCPKCKIRLGD